MSFSRPRAALGASSIVFLATATFFAFAPQSSDIAPGNTTLLPAKRGGHLPAQL